MVLQCRLEVFRHVEALPHAPRSRKEKETVTADGLNMTQDRTRTKFILVRSGYGDDECHYFAR